MAITFYDVKDKVTHIVPKNDMRPEWWQELDVYAIMCDGTRIDREEV